MLTQVGWRRAVFFLVAFLVLAADQSVKIWVRTYQEGQTICEAGLFQLIRVHNTGAAFGLFRDYSLVITIIDIILLIAILIFVLVFVRRFTFINNRLGMLTLGLVFGGLLGNLIDRLRLGYVTDFIDIGIWPTFNIADSASTVGIIMFIYILIFLSRAKTTDLST